MNTSIDELWDMGTATTTQDGKSYTVMISNRNKELQIVFFVGRIYGNSERRRMVRREALVRALGEECTHYMTEEAIKIFLL